MSDLLETIKAPFSGSGRAPTIARSALSIVGFLFILDTIGLLEITEPGWSSFVPSIEGVKNTLPLLTNGGSQGTLYGLLAVGLILIYRTNKIINFAVAAIGVVPAVFAVLLVLTKDIPWILALVIALAGGTAVGAIVDIVLVRRFAQSPRLILTVATIGIAQILAFINIYVPRFLGVDGLPPGNFSDTTPFASFKVSNSAGVPYGSGNNVAALVVVIACALGLQTFFKQSKIGIALRASAENADRAGLLGIPVKKVQTISWAIAGFFGAVVVFFQASLTSVPLDGTLGYTTLLFALAAAVVAKMESIPTAVVAGIGIGIIDFAETVKNTGESAISTAVMLVFILAALAFQKGGGARAKDTGVSSFKALQEFSPIPAELRNLAEVQFVRTGVIALVGVIFLIAPFVVGEAKIPKLTLLPIYAMIGLSLVVLTGWAGQISLGQFAFAGVGATTAAKLFIDFGWDFWLTLVAAAIAGALVAALVGLPALRVQGLLLAVSSLALAAAAEGYIFRNRNDNYKVGQAILPSDDIDFMERPLLWGRIDIRQQTPNGFFAGDRGFYYLCVVFLLLMFVAVTSYRRFHAGRVLIASRDNERAAQSYSISIIRTRLAAFAVSGAMAAIAGALLAYQQRAIDASVYGVQPSIDVFVATVIGGLTSLGGAMAGVLIVTGLNLFGDNLIDGLSLLVSGPGLLLVLLFLPGGLAEGGIKIRDVFLKAVATRRNIRVPSLFADMRVEDEEKERADSIISEAEESAEHFGEDELVQCPVCQAVLQVDEVLGHEHLRMKPDDTILVEA